MSRRGAAAPADHELVYHEYLRGWLARSKSLDDFDIDMIIEPPEWVGRSALRIQVAYALGHQDRQGGTPMRRLPDVVDMVDEHLGVSS